MSAAAFASKGDYKNALAHWDLARGTSIIKFSQARSDSINSLYKKVPAKDYILEQAKSEQIIIINEAHHNAYHRFFTRSLLNELFKLGYKNLGLEGLSNGKHLDTRLLKRGYPIQETGWYIIEPQFGNMVRAALEIGFNVFPYEQTSGTNGKLREIEQAKNISEIIKNRPNEKFLIHCGYDHALEGTHSTWDKAMAGRLKEYTGIDPLTINQVAYSEKSEPKFNDPLLKAINPQEPVVLLDTLNEPFRYTRGRAWCDIAVFHPNTDYLENRPDWIFDYPNQKTKIDLSDIRISFPVLILAFKKGEDITKAVPFDIHEVYNKAEDCFMGLKSGDYTIVVMNRTESVKFDKTVR